MKSRAEWFLLPLAAVALGGAHPPQDVNSQPALPVPPADTPAGTSQPAPGETRHDQVGFASIGAEASQGRTTVYASHPSLPPSSFAEVTALDTGRTILVAITARAPLSDGTAIRLSPAAASQLGLASDKQAPVRIRAVQPSAQDEAALISGGAGPVRLDAPPALLKGLRAMLPSPAPTQAAGPATPNPPVTSTSQEASRPPAPPPSANAARPPSAAPGRPAAATSAVETSSASSAASTPAGSGAVSAPGTPSPAAPRPAGNAPVTAAPAAAGTSGAVRAGQFVVQVATLANAANARALATRLSGYTETAGRFTRVRTGPFDTRAAADAARAKAVAAGYGDATVIRAK